MPKLSFTKDGTPTIDGAALKGTADGESIWYSAGGYTIIVNSKGMYFQTESNYDRKSFDLELDMQGYKNLNTWLKDKGTKDFLIRGFNDNSNSSLRLDIPAASMRPSDTEITKEFGLKLNGSDVVELWPSKGLKPSILANSHSSSIGSIFTDARAALEIRNRYVQVMPEPEIRKKAVSDLSYAISTAQAEALSADRSAPTVIRESPAAERRR